MKQIIYNIRYCTGCAACSQVCPRGAVVMEADEEGFLFPEVNEEQCNDCGLCRRTCPVNAAFEKTRSIVMGTDGSSVFTAGGSGVPVFVSRDSTGNGSSQNGSSAAGFVRNGGSAAGNAPDDIISSVSGQEERMPGPGGGSPAVAETGNSDSTADAANNDPVPAFRGKRAFACWSKNDATREKSSSGGIFSELAAKTLEDGGVVFGAAFDADFSVRHRSIENIGDLDVLRRSKYVQSQIGETFREAGKYLAEGRKVLFCGTPCQIAGLKSYLGSKGHPGGKTHQGAKYGGLITCEIACFGVPSPKVWRMFLDYLEERYASGISSVSFRDKSTGWRESSVRVRFGNGAEYLVGVKKELYLMGYFKNLFTRKSCFDCMFKVHNSHADLTLADFWGIEKLAGPAEPGDPAKQCGPAEPGAPAKARGQAGPGDPAGPEEPMVSADPEQFKSQAEMKGPSRHRDPSVKDDNRGISLVITHTEAGENALSAIKDRVGIVEYPPGDAVRYNPRLVSSLPEPAGRARFFADMENGYSFNRLRRKYMDNTSIRYKIKCIIKKILGRS